MILTTNFSNCDFSLEQAEEMTTLILNEFVEKIVVHERVTAKEVFKQYLMNCECVCGKIMVLNDSIYRNLRRHL